MKIKKILFAALSPIFAFSAAQAADYYYIATFDDIQGTVTMGSAAAWSLSPVETVTPDSGPGAGDMLHFYETNGYLYGGEQVCRVNMPSGTALTVGGVEAEVSSEFWIRRNLSVAGDWTQTVTSNKKYSSETSGIRQLRFAVTDGGDVISVGGDMVLNTSGYFTARMSNGRSSVAASGGVSLNVGGALAFNFTGFTGTLADKGYHVFDMRDSQSKTTGGNAMLFNLGGLKSGGRAVWMTSATSAVAHFNFNDNSSGAFAGGSFEGVFATESGVSSQLDITMNGSGRQEMAIYKSANGSLHGFENDLDGKADMAIGSLAVNSGEFIMNTEVAVENLYLSGGKLKFSSAEKVGGMTIDGGTLLFGGTIRTGDLTVAAYSADIVFSAEDLAAHEITVFEFDYLTDDFDANSVFSAYDESGMKLGGTFELIGEAGGAGSLVYSVPEPAAIAALIGAVALMFVALRRRQR